MDIEFNIENSIKSAETIEVVQLLFGLFLMPSSHLKFSFTDIDNDY